MIIRYRKAEKIGDHAVTSILTIQDADQASLDKVLKYFDPEVSQQELAVSSAPSEPQPKPQKDDIEFNPDMSIKVEKKPIKLEDVAKSIVKSLPKKVEVKEEPKASRPKRLPLLRGSVNEQDNPDDENMRTISDVPHYRVKVDCPKCGVQPDGWGRSYNRFIKCYECGTKLEQQPATSNKLNADEDGYYFHASQPYTETRED